ncbi:aminotransferase [Caulobacter sp. CCUG 60055]|nr:aminotransferase class V-fold PLP-dependent enzyme [Caulobacter sp. CCUG 60055]MBQ1544123.1 aminotransferase class V-fold PLP-dependent enzyme [Caulobacteraceae bacterium]MCI3180429.1 aminotransferase [Caulobacter sp. CCUG 60055]
MSEALTRRGVLAAAGVAAGAVGAAPAGAAPSAVARDEAYWAKVAAQFDAPRDFVQLENGNWGMAARPVMAAYEQHLDMVNRRTSFYSRRQFGGDLAKVRARVAAMLGVEADEIAFTRGATEALQALIGGYNRLRAGDAVLFADLDYDSMQSAMGWLKARRGVDVVRIALPEPASHQGLIDAYEAALKADPRVRLILLTQVSHRTGLVLPVKEIAAMARARGVDAVVDAAHAWGQMDFRLGDLGLDFVGLNGHKWIGAPLGVGVMYIRRGRVGDIDPFMGSEALGADDVSARVHSGTTNMAAFLAVPDALDFREAIGGPAVEARLRALRARWVEPALALGRYEILTPADPRLSCGITAFRRKGRVSDADNQALARELFDRFGVFTVHRAGLASGACVRVTPAIFTSADDVDRLAAALKAL